MATLLESAARYGSVHRGSGFDSLVTSAHYEQARSDLVRFFGADPDYHEFFFHSNTTCAINHVARRLALAPGEFLLITLLEHHSNILPWRTRWPIQTIGADSLGRLDLADLDQRLKHAGGRVRLVAITGASNVTGHLPPLSHVARLAHEHGAWLLVDAAQLAAHRPINMAGRMPEERIDFLVFSGHKVYAPFGSGGLISPREFFAATPPETVGGGTVKLVGDKEIIWAEAPEREEAGTPNALGALALAAAVGRLQEIGWDTIIEHERQLTRRLLDHLSRIPKVRIYGDDDHTLARDRLGIVPITMAGIDHGLLAAVLSHEWNIGVRHGCFCAQPYVMHLLGIESQERIVLFTRIMAGEEVSRPGLVRISLGFFNRSEEIDWLAEALEAIARNGPCRRYLLNPDSGEYFPENYSADPDLNLNFKSGNGDSERQDACKSKMSKVSGLLPTRKLRAKSLGGFDPESRQPLMNSSNWILVASYNEKENLAALIPLLVKTAPSASILIIDDRSPDGTAQYVTALMRENPKIHFHQRAGKLGYGTAILDGFYYALERGADLVVTLDADLSHDPQAIPDLFAALDDHDLAIGSRYRGGIRILNWSLRRLALSLGANLYVQRLLGLKVEDATSGYRAYRREAVEFLLRHPPTSTGYSFLVECLFFLTRAGFKVAEVPIVYHERRVGQSKMSRGVIFEAMWRPLALRLKSLWRKQTPPHEANDKARALGSTR